MKFPIRRFLGSFLLLALFVASALAQSQPSSPGLEKGESRPPQTQIKNSVIKPQPDQRGTVNAPFVVQVSPSPISDEEAVDEAAYHKKKTEGDWWLIGITGVLAVAALLQWIVLLHQARLLRKSIRTQTTDMGRYITESHRAATAMEGVATSMATQVATTTAMAQNQREFWQRQMRAYLSISTAGFVPQDRNTGWKYEIRLFLRNNGHTPAHAVAVSSKAKLMLFPLPDEIDLALPVDRREAAGHIGPGQQFFFRAWLDELITDEEIVEMNTGTNLRLYVYGTIYYRDAFGDDHNTNFCQFCVWDLKGNLVTINIPRHNDAT